MVTKLPVGMGQGAASEPSLDVARDLIYGATNAYLAVRADAGGSEVSQIVLTLAQPMSGNHHRRIDVELETIRQLLHARRHLPVYDVFAAAAFLLILHRRLLQVARDSDPRMAESVHAIVASLGLDRVEVWSAAFTLAARVEKVDGYNFAPSLQELRSSLS